MIKRFLFRTKDTGHILFVRGYKLDKQKRTEKVIFYIKRAFSNQICVVIAK